MESFKPPWPLTNGHVQTCLASVGPRRIATRFRAASLCLHSEELLLTGGGGCLQGFYTPHPNPVGLASLIHGWEGSARSSYLLGAALALYQSGFSVFRLNLRDHGDTHSLNEEPFNAARLEEVTEALKTVTLRFPHPRHVLVGFSLGGNFALRVARVMRVSPR